jgi:apolipoprotein D and lipocalin family protein
VKLFVFLAVLFPLHPTFAIQTVDHVDVSQYVGRWYQISRNPTFFEPSNCVCAQQTLTLLEDGPIGVYNSCNEGEPQGPLNDIRGTATVEDETTNSKLIVDFNLPFKGSYWIIGVASDYHWAAVTDKDGRTLYILSKTPTLSEDSYKEALAAASAQVSVDRLVTTDHTNCIYPE